MSQKVYVVTESDYERHDILGVYADVERAKAAHPCKWAQIGTSDPEGWYEDNPRRRAQLVIESHELK